MPDIDVARLVSTYEARTTQYERALKRLETKNGRASKRLSRQFASVDKSIARASSTMRSFASAVGAGFAVGGIASVPATFRAILSSSSALVDVSDKVGLGVERLQEYRFAAEQTGVASGTLDMAMQRFSRRVGEAAEGTGELAGTLKQYGIQVRDATGQTRSVDSVLNDVADAIQNAESHQERLRIAFKAFDSEGAALVNTLRNGSDGLRELTDAARAADAVLSEDLLRSAKQVDEQFAAFSATVSTKMKRGVLQALDAFKTLSFFMADPASQSTEKLLDKKKALTDEINRLSAAGAKATVDLQRLAAVEEELAKRSAARTSQSADAPGNVGRALPSGAPVPRAKPGEDKLAAFSLKLAEQREAAEKRATEMQAKRNQEIERTISNLQMELQLVGATNAERQTATTLANLNLEAGSKQAQQIAGLIAQIDAKQMKMKALEDANAKAADAAARFRDISADLFSTISSGAQLSTRDMIQLVAQFAQLAQLAKDGGGTAVLGGGSSNPLDAIGAILR